MAKPVRPTGKVPCAHEMYERVHRRYPKAMARLGEKRHTDKRWRGAVFDLGVGALLAFSIYHTAVWLAIPMVAAGKKALRAVGLL